MNAPLLRFKEFSDKWNEQIFSDLYSFFSTNSFSREFLNYENGEVKNIHYGDIHTKFNTHFNVENEVVPFINTNVSLDRIKDSSYCQVGDLVIADASEDYADVGKTIEITNLGNNKVLAGLHTFLARPNGNTTYTGFSSLLLKSWKSRKQIMTIAQGTKVLGISTGRLGKIKLDIPSLPEQQKIASFLGAVDKRIELLTKKKDLLQEHKKGVMQKLFSQEIRFKNENGNDYPEWEDKKLGELTFKTGRKNKENIAYPIYSINNKEGFVPQSTQFEGMDSTSRGYDISLYKVIQKQTFAYNPARINVGSIGYSGDLENIIISSLYVCFKTIVDLEDGYLSHYLNTFEFNKSVLRNVEGGVREYLFYENFSGIKIKLPSNQEQLRIVEFLDSIDQKIEQTTLQLEGTKTFKKGLLQRMFV